MRWWAQLLAVVLPGLIVCAVFWPNLTSISGQRFLYIQVPGLFFCAVIFAYAISAPVPKWMRFLGACTALAYPVALVL